MQAFLIKWLIVAGVVAVLAGLAWHYRGEAQNARDAQAVAERSAEIAAADAKRWMAAAEERGRLIESQNAQIEAARADLARASRIIVEAAGAAQQAQDAAEARIRAWREKARANPSQAMPLGPIARDALGVLLEP